MDIFFFFMILNLDKKNSSKLEKIIVWIVYLFKSWQHFQICIYDYIEFINKYQHRQKYIDFCIQLKICINLMNIAIFYLHVIICRKVNNLLLQKLQILFIVRTVIFLIVTKINDLQFWGSKCGKFAFTYQLNLFLILMTYYNWPWLTKDLVWDKH